MNILNIISISGGLEWETVILDDPEDITIQDLCCGARGWDEICALAIDCWFYKGIFLPIIFDNVRDAKIIKGMKYYQNEMKANRVTKYWNNRFNINVDGQWYKLIAEGLDFIIAEPCTVYKIQSWNVMERNACCGIGSNPLEKNEDLPEDFINYLIRLQGVDGYGGNVYNLPLLTREKTKGAFDEDSEG